jgi:very-short-patch-repair endonuclease
MKWNTKNDQTLINLVNEGLTRSRISEIMNITYRSIDSRCYRLNIKISRQEKIIVCSCLKCGNLFSSLISKNRKYCSNSCSAKDNLPNRILSEKTKEKIRNSLTGRISPRKGISKEKRNCIVCGKKVNKLENIYCSRKCKNESDIYRKKMSDISIERYKQFPEQHPNIRCSNIRETYPEKFFKQYLLDNGLIEKIDFNFQYSIGRYFVDFYFPIINLTVEIDGERWHDKESEKEKIREKYIRERSELIRFDVKPLLKKEFEKVVLDIIKRVK